MSIAREKSHRPWMNAQAASSRAEDGRNREQRRGFFVLVLSFLLFYHFSWLLNERMVQLEGAQTLLVISSPPQNKRGIPSQSQQARRDHSLGGPLPSKISSGEGIIRGFCVCQKLINFDSSRLTILYPRCCSSWPCARESSKENWVTCGGQQNSLCL